MDNDNQNQGQEVDWQLQYAAVNRTCTSLANQNLELLKQRGLLEEMNAAQQLELQRAQDSRSEVALDHLGLEQDYRHANARNEELIEELHTVQNQISTLSSWAKDMIESIKSEGATWLIEDEYGNDEEGLDVVYGIIAQWTDGDDEVVAVQLRSEGDDDNKEG